MHLARHERAQMPAQPATEIKNAWSERPGDASSPALQRHSEGEREPDGDVFPSGQRTGKVALAGA